MMPAYIFTRCAYSLRNMFPGAFAPFFFFVLVVYRKQVFEMNMPEASMQDRIYGLEDEYALHPHRVLERNFQLAQDVIMALSPRERNGIPVVPFCREYFMANQGRLYVDSPGLHFEAATQECANAHDLVVCDKADERILERIANKVNAADNPQSDTGMWWLKIESERFGGLAFLKTNIAPNVERDRIPDKVDRFGKQYTSWGRHMNILLDRTKITQYQAVDILAPFVCASHWFTGAGFVFTDGTRPRYALSQRALFVNKTRDTEAIASDQKKPVFLLRDEPLADRERYYRLQIVGLDSSLCEWPTYVSAGVMGLALRMAEDGFIRTEDYRTDYYKSVWHFYRDCLEMQDATVWLGTERDNFKFQGRDYNAGSLHRELYLDRMRAYKASNVPWNDEEDDIMEKYETLIELFEKAQSSEELAELLAPFVNQAAKLYYLILPDMRRRGYSFASRSDARIGASEHSSGTSVGDRLKLLDARYHDTRRDRGLYYQLVKRGMIERIVGEEEIARAMNEPLPGTRAERRGCAVQEMMKNRVFIHSVSWQYAQGYYAGEDRNQSPHFVWMDGNPFGDNHIKE